MSSETRLKLAVSAAAMGLLVVRHNSPNVVRADSVSLGLLAFAFLPWVSSLIKAAELPGGWKIEFWELKQKVAQQQELINDLVKYSMSASIFHHLCGIALLRRYNYVDDDVNRREFYFLRDNGLIRPKADGGFVDFGPALHGRNLVDEVTTTPIGRLAVKLRRTDIPVNMLSDEKNIATPLTDL